MPVTDRALPAWRPQPSCVLILAALCSQSAMAGTDPVALPAVTVPVLADMSTPLSSYRVNEDTMAQSSVSSSDTASLFSRLPGVNQAGAGGVAGLPMVRGLGDDRIKYLVDGMPITAACPNHMNPALSYIDPAGVANARLYAGITPVSMGGDSIAGTMVVDSPSPVFAEPGKIVTNSRFSSVYRSNGNGLDASVQTAVGNDQASLGYSGAWSRSQDTVDGNGNTITSSYYQRLNQLLTLGMKGEQGLWVLALGQQSTPREGFTNQQMDTTGNQGNSVTLHYQGDYAWGQLDSQVYWQDVQHQMNVGQDKSTFPRPMYMPMNTHSKSMGYSVKAALPLSAQDTVQIGNEYRHTTLDDWWPPVPGNTTTMGPGTFVHVNDGRRDQFAGFAEWERQWSLAWSSLFGLRGDVIRSNAGLVQGYSPNYAADANAFNARDHFRQDNNIDFTALTRYVANANSRYELGYARKSQAPSLYQRYAWSTNGMASAMINWYGDGNGYVGHPDLKSEVAHTVSATADWHDANPVQPRWQVNITPYYSRVENYIDIDPIGKGSRLGGKVLRFANHDARLYGVDVSGMRELWRNAAYGRGTIQAVVGWTRGKRLDSGGDLYHMMPLNARLTLAQEKAQWQNVLELRLVARKTAVDQTRNEPQTPGYVLVNPHIAYQLRKGTSLRLRISNLFDTAYREPLGGVNLDQVLQSRGAQPSQAIAGQGRSVDVGLSMLF